MRSFLLIISVVLVIFCDTLADQTDNKQVNKDAKSAFGTPFDEIVVESSLTVRRKTPGRQGRNQNTTTAKSPVIIKTKRELPRSRRQFGGSAANSQAQAFNTFGPLGSFGASATGAQTQGFQAGPGGLSNSAAFSGTQQYNFNGQTVDIAFGNTFSGAPGSKSNAGGAAITITGPDGRKRPFQG